jgi:conjugative transfer ATPase
MSLFKRKRQSQTQGKKRVVTDKDIDQLYQYPPSITDCLPWVDFDDDSQVFTLSDGVSAGAMFEIIGVPTDARPDSYLREVQENIQTCINHAIPQLDNPFIVQCFVQDEDSLASLSNQLDDYMPQHNQDDLSQHFFSEFREHLKRVSDPNGLFKDSAVTGSAWSGKVRRIRVFLYRWRGKNSKEDARNGIDPVTEINEVAEKLVAQMQSTGINVRRCHEADLYDWLLRWFNPKAEVTEGDLDKLLALAPCPIPHEKTAGYDLSSLVMLSQPVSDQETGTWMFDELPHKAITIDALRRKPQAGHLTGERKIGEHLYAVFDKLPPGTVLSVCITLQPQDLIENSITNILHAAKGETAEAIATERDAVRGLELMSNGDYLFPTVITLFLRGDNQKQLRQRTNAANALLLANGLHPIKEKDELLPLNTYIRQLPMNYEPDRDTLEKKSRLLFSSDLANLLPFYGRSRGTGNPGMVFFNRGGEPFVFDPLNKADRSKNAFGLVLGPPGSGKSSLMVYLLLLIITLHKARVYIIEKGDSFRLLGEYCKKFGLSVNQVSLRPNQNVSLPPFSDALLMLQKEKAALKKQDFLDQSIDTSDARDEQEDIDDEERDYLGEMELKARVMITGGDPKEEDQLTRADRLTIRKGIVNAAMAKQAGIDQANEQNLTLTPKDKQVLTIDVVKALNELSKDNDIPLKRRERAKDMADSMELYCSGTAGHFFNRPGEAWPEADVTILEMGLLANEGYEDQLALGFMGLMGQINGVVEREQYSNRPTFVLADEAHLITTNALLSVYLVKIVKMWRKLGAWLWLATQNLEDFPDAAKKLLSMFEWWIAMVCPKEEIEQISRFKDLTEEEKSMLLAAHKEPGLYTEGVVLADKVKGLFRNVPPPLALALAMTEKHEKRERAEIMRELGYTSELDAVFEVARRLKKLD